MKAKLMIVPLVVVLAAIGCDQHMRNFSAPVDGQSGSAPELRPAARTPIPDFPVPVGFSLDESQSRSFAAGGSRSVFHVYKGRANKFDVARFYRKQMAVNRWVLVTDRFVLGEVKMDFEKETERCDVIINSGRSRSSVSIQVELFTSARIKSRDQKQK